MALKHSSLGFADDELFGSENLWDRCPKIQIFVGLESDMSCCKDFRRCFAFIYCICVHCTLVIWPVGRHSQLKSHFGCAKYGKIISTCEGIRRRSRGSDGHYKAVSKSIYIYIYILYIQMLRHISPHINLVGGLEHEFYFPYIGNNHHPNWRSHIFQRGR